MEALGASAITASNRRSREKENQEIGEKSCSGLQAVIISCTPEIFPSPPAEPCGGAGWRWGLYLGLRGTFNKVLKLCPQGFPTRFVEAALQDALQPPLSPLGCSALHTSSRQDLVQRVNTQFMAVPLPQLGFCGLSLLTCLRGCCSPCGQDSLGCGL